MSKTILNDVRWKVETGGVCRSIWSLIFRDLKYSNWFVTNKITGEKWRLRPSSGIVPTWVFSQDRRIPGTSPKDYIQFAKLARAGAEQTVADCVGTKSILYERLWQPLSRAVLNTDASEGSA